MKWFHDVKLSLLKFSDRTFYILLNDQQCVARIVAVVFTFPPSLTPSFPSLPSSLTAYLPTYLPTYLSPLLHEIVVH